ncbi:MAG: hypothetical protein ACRC1Z_26570, partial [Waterburya sp.]
KERLSIISKIWSKLVFGIVSSDKNIRYSLIFLFYLDLTIVAIAVSLEIRLMLMRSLVPENYSKAIAKLV